MLYSDWITAVCTILEIPVVTATAAAPSSDTNFNNIYPRAIEYAEQRMYRELDLLATRVTDPSASTTPNNRKFTLPTTTGTFLVVEEVTPFVAGVRQTTLLPVSRPFVDSTWPADAAPTNPSIPLYWAPYDNANILLAPAPDSNYTIEIVGTQRPSPLSAARTATILTTMLPDAFLAASMVFLAGYQRDFGAQSDDPRMAMSWEGAYQKAMQSALIEEIRKKYQSQGWTSMLPSPIVTPPLPTPPVR